MFHASRTPRPLSLTLFAIANNLPTMGRRSKHRKSKDASVVEFQTVLRIRPLLKKEREDPVLLEPLHGADADLSTVVLHPMPERTTVDLLSPSSMLVRQTLSPDAVKTAKDEDYRVDHVWSAEDDQDKLYFSLGLPMALAVMEPLKVDPRISSVPTVNHLTIAMGVAGSGTSYTCWGQAIQKRKAEKDGLVPRMIDSLFSQSKHHLVNKRNYSFAVRVSILQVSQSKNTPIDCELRDLMQPVASRTLSSLASSATSTISSISSKSAALANTTSIESGSMASSKRTTSTASSKYSSLDEPVFVEQDAESADFRVVNGQVRTCRNAEEARDALATAMRNSAKLASKRRQAHVLVKLQPVMTDRHGNLLREGGTLAVLDMAGCDEAKHVATSRSKDSVATGDDAHNAVMHCLRTHQINAEIRAGKDVGDADCRKDRRSLERGKSFRKVSYRQHKLTMLLQPVFASAGSTMVTLLVAAYPGHRDYAEKKSLLNEVIAFRQSLPSATVATGLASPASTQSSVRPKKSDKRSDRKKVTYASDADDEHSLDKAKRVPPMSVPTDITLNNPIAVAPGVDNVASMTYSDSTLEDSVYEPMPPPIAPSYRALSPSLMSPEASAPLETDSGFLTSFDRRHVTDFPGVNMPDSPGHKSFVSDESAPPSPPYHGVMGIGKVVEERIPSPFEPAKPSNMFSPMKTINKVVHSSKKQGMKVMEKVSQFSADMMTVDEGVAKQLKLLEIENEKLTKETRDLRSKNESLRVENAGLRGQKGYKKELESLRRKNESLEKEIKQLRAQLTRGNADGDRPTPSRQPLESQQEHRPVTKSLLDNSIFEHMNHMNAYNY